MRYNHEAVEMIIHDWAKNLWLHNNSRGLKSDRALLERQFHDAFYNAGAKNSRDLSAVAKISEQAFVLFCYGTAPLGLGNTKLTDVWRKNVWRNHFQRRFNVFETILKETIEKSGEKKAVQLFPRSGFTGAEIAGYIEVLNYKSKHVDLATVTRLIRESDNLPPPKTPKPKA